MTWRVVRSHKISAWLTVAKELWSSLRSIAVLAAQLSTLFFPLEISLMRADFTGLYSVWPVTERMKSKSGVHFPFEPCTRLHIEKDIPRLTPAGQLSEMGLLVMWTNR